MAIALICTYSLLLAQQKNKINVASTIDKKDYFYIPASALSDTIQGILYQEKFKVKAATNKRPIKFYWISTCNDGYYNLTITPEQIFFSSSHDNPNPNFLFCVTDIDSIQYNQIRKGLQKTPQGFENLSKNYNESQTVFFDKKFKDGYRIPIERNNKNMKQQEFYCERQRKLQLKKYFSILNSYISKNNNKIQIPSVKMKPKFFSYFEQELYDWVPTLVNQKVRFNTSKKQ
ncbi:hypothetical protein GCM10023229_18130 [Flavisolibacter ginsenosidimutans]